MGVFHFVMRKRFLRVTFEPENAENVKTWDFLFYVSFGIMIAFSVEIAGVLMVFSALVIPAVIAFLYTNQFGRALLVAWGAGTVAIVGGIGTSFYLDIATGPLLVCAFGVVLVIAVALRPLLGIRPEGEIVVPGLGGGQRGIVSPRA